MYAAEVAALGTAAAYDDTCTRESMTACQSAVIVANER